MKLGTYVFDGQTRIGCVVGDEVADLERLYARYLSEVEGDRRAEGLARARISSSMLHFIRGGESSWEAAVQALEHFETRRAEGDLFAEVRPLREVRLRAPLQPDAVVCAGYGPAQAEDMDLYRHAEFFVKSGPHVIGSGDPISHEPEVAKDLRSEVELGIIIGQGGKDIPQNEVLDHIFGFTIFTDILAADQLSMGMEGGVFHSRVLEGVCLEAAGALGPWIVTKDEIEGGVENLSHRLWVNGELQEEFKPDELPIDPLSFVSHLSTFFTLDPGIVIASGSPGGPRLGRSDSGGPTLAVPAMKCGFLKLGDKIKAEIDSIGSLENSVEKIHEDS